MRTYCGIALSLEEAICHAAEMVAADGHLATDVTLNHRNLRRLRLELGFAIQWVAGSEVFWMYGPRGMIKVRPDETLAQAAVLLDGDERVCEIELSA